MGLLETAQAGQVKAVHLWGIWSVEEALIACHDLWWRTPGGGRWPYAGDGPWHLIQGEAGDYAGDGQDSTSSSAKPRTPLSSAEVDERDRMTVWLEWLDDPVDRGIVHRASHALWRGETRVPWMEIKRQMGWAKSMDSLAWRYRKGLALIACRLNGWSTRRAQAMAARSHAAE